MSKQHSMTGYGRFTLDESQWSQVWEVKSVNSRHLDLKWRLPVFLRSQEPALEKIVREYAARGRVELNLALTLHATDLMAPAFNSGQAQGMIRELQTLAGELGLDYKPDLNRLLNISPLWEDPMLEPDPKIMASVEQGLRAALEDWNRFRVREGEHLLADLNKRLERMRAWQQDLKRMAPEVKESRFEGARSRVQNLMERFGLEHDESRLLQELALLADRLDVTEELTRLDGHLKQLGVLLQGKGEAGKRLDFLLQECFREITTCGNKAQDSEMSMLVVDFKAELEKCREQVQNLE